jgi:hypothetical protein
VTVSFTVTNNSPGHQHVATVHLDSVTADGVTQSQMDCQSMITANSGDFTMPDITVGLDYANGGPYSSGANSSNVSTANPTGTLTFNNAANRSQDACKSATLTLHLSST